MRNTRLVISMQKFSLTLPSEGKNYAQFLHIKRFEPQSIPHMIIQPQNMKLSSVVVGNNTLHGEPRNDPDMIYIHSW